jgi:hypothetical protein
LRSIEASGFIVALIMMTMMNKAKNAQNMHSLAVNSFGATDSHVLSHAQAAMSVYTMRELERREKER